jgi:hypothetical protein
MNELTSSGPRAAKPGRVAVAVALPVVAWATSFALGLAGALGALSNAGGVGLLLAELVMGVVLTALAVRLWLRRSKRRRGQLVLALPSVLLGAILGAVAGALFTLGVFLPYAAGWGGHELEDFGGNEFSWQSWLRTLLASLVIAVAAAGAVGGLFAWAVGFASGRHGGRPHGKS